MEILNEKPAHVTENKEIPNQVIDEVDDFQKQTLPQEGLSPVLDKTTDSGGKKRKILGPVDFFDYNFVSNHFWLKLLAPFAKGILKLGWDIRFEGMENIPKDQDCIFMPNHVSHFDGPLVIVGAASHVRGSFDIIGDEKLFNNKWFNHLLDRFNAFPVRKNSKDMWIVDYAIKRCRKNSMLWFPEGQRHKNPSINKLNPGKLGSGMLAHSTTNAIIPVFISGAEFAMPVGRRLRYGKGLRSIKILVRYGKPVDIEDLRNEPTSKENSKTILDRIMNAIEELRPAGPYRDQSRR